ncbi:hypothetical protein ECC02_013248 [Trypanosoma cruzi]|uniref:Leishmanolysin-like peptidase n=1 Tax=Trypanosoma cruzi TaxID=5693 RepID=A0A7J6XID3_TRYCR|nr:hypothetical protein ECC02_013248 [Trypanosoma cruzi]
MLCVWPPLCSPVTPLRGPHSDALLAQSHFVFLTLLFPLFLFSRIQAAPLLLLTRNQKMHFTQVMRQPRCATPLFPLAVLLLMCCAVRCVAAVPATQYRFGFDMMMRRNGPLPTAVVREVPRKGQGAMQAYTVATQDDDSGWEPIRMAVSTEDLERGTNKRKKYCEEGEDECYNALGHRVSCKAEHFLTEEKKQLCTGKILPGAVKLHAERLLVKPTGGTITVPRAVNGPCSHFTVPTRHKSDGVPNADFIIYAAARPSGTDSRAVWAATCNTLTDFCPSIGAMNFDRST